MMNVDFRIALQVLFACLRMLLDRSGDQELQGVDPLGREGLLPQKRENHRRLSVVHQKDIVIAMN